MTSSTTPAHPRVGVLSVCLAGVAWGTAPVALAAVHDLSTLAVSAYRLAIAAVVLIALSATTSTLRPAVALARREPVITIGVGVGVGVYQAVWFAAVVRVGAAVATVIALGLAPVLITVGESVRARRRPAARRGLAVLGGVCGLGLVATARPDTTPGSAPVLGLLLAVGSGLTYAAVTMLGRRAAVTTAPLALTTATTTIGAVALVPAALLTGPVVTAAPLSLLALGYLGAVTMAGGYLLLYSGLRTTTGGAAAVATLLEPVTAAALAVTVLGETLAARGVVGILLILAAVGLLGGQAPE